MAVIFATHGKLLPIKSPEDDFHWQEINPAHVGFKSAFDEYVIKIKINFSELHVSPKRRPVLHRRFLSLACSLLSEQLKFEEAPFSSNF